MARYGFNYRTAQFYGLCIIINGITFFPAEQTNDRPILNIVSQLTETDWDVDEVVLQEQQRDGEYYYVIMIIPGQG